MILFWSFVIILAAFLPLVFLMRNRMLSWGWNFALMAVLLYGGLYKMTGTPRDAWMFSAIEGIHGPVQVVYSAITKDYIYLVIRQEGGVPFYIKLVTVKEIEDDLKKATMEADQARSAILADADMLSKWNVKLGKQDSDNQDDNSAAAKLAKGGAKKGATAAKGETPKSGGKRMFYPTPQTPDPLKFHGITIEVPPPEMTVPQ